jgi:hypothetical protein
VVDPATARQEWPFARSVVPTQKAERGHADDHARVRGAGEGLGHHAGVAAEAEGVVSIADSLKAAGFIEPELSFVGVYVLMNGDEVVWIGRTTCLPNRVIGHRKRTGDFDRVLFLPLPKEHLAAYEGALIRALLPTKNVNSACRVGSDNDVLEALGLPTHADEKAATKHAQKTLRARRSPRGAA